MTVDESLTGLEKAAELRLAARTAIERLSEHTEDLTAVMSGAEDRLTSIRESIVTLDERADQLGVTGAAMDRFEERLRQWQALETRMAHATAQATQREDVLKALRADVTRMFALAEETADQVRETLAARGELEAGRALLDGLKPQLSEMRAEAERLAEHREALAGEDALIARMEAMLCEVRTK